MVNSEHLSILRRGVERWNQWRGERPDISPDLSQSTLKGMNLSGANLRFADLNCAVFQETPLDLADLCGANLGYAILSQATLNKACLSFADLNFTDLNRAILSQANLSFTNLSGADLSQTDLSFVDLSGARLSHANLSGADLSFADLSNALLNGANLTLVQALTTNFSQSTLTGAIIENWDIGPTTQFDGIVCDYLLWGVHPATGEPMVRLPANAENTLAAGEFAQYILPHTNAVDIVQLAFPDGIDWRAFLAAFQALCQQRRGDIITLQGLEQDHETLIISLEVPQQVDATAIATQAQQLYATELSALDTRYADQLRWQGNWRDDNLQAIAAQRQVNATLLDIVGILARHQPSPLAQQLGFDQMNGTGQGARRMPRHRSN